MFTQWLKKWTTRQQRPRMTGRAKRRPSRWRPGLEVLETREVPAVLTVNSLQDLAVNLSDTIVTLRDALYAAQNHQAVAPGGPAGSGADTIAFDPSLFASGPARINL